MLRAAAAGGLICLLGLASAAHAADFDIGQLTELLAKAKPGEATFTERRQVAMLDFAMKVSRQAEEIGEADFERLRAHGFGDEDAWDIGAIAALFALSNRMANLTNMRPNDEFYLMGRLPK